MRQLSLWPTCAICGHHVNPRSEVCVQDHRPCSSAGCQVGPGQWPRTMAGPEPATIRAEGLQSGTQYLIDLASYQAGIRLDVVHAAGFDHVNIKLTQGDWYTWAAGPSYADEARALGMDVIGFMWLDNSAPGAVQAAYAWQQAQKVGARGIQVDCEDSARPATQQVWRDCVNWLQDKLGYPVVNYTGDWWWQPRGWDGAGLTPYLWAGPNNGYLSSYPGDTSAAWRAGYGGWPTYSLLQYAVQPIDNAAGGNLSKTAIRDPAVWAALTGRNTDMALGDEKVPGTSTPGMGDRSAATVLSDIWNAVTRGRLSGGDLWSESPLAQLLGRPPATFTPEQIAGLAGILAEALVAHVDTPLSDADKPAITAAVKDALAGLTLHAQ